MLNRIRRLWANVTGWFALARQLRLCRMERDEALRLLEDEKRKQKAAFNAYRARCSDNEFQAKEIATLKADTAEHARDAQALQKVRTENAHLKHANEVMKGKYREACELLTHRNATCEHYRKMYGDIRARLCDGEFTVVDTAREGE